VLIGSCSDLMKSIKEFEHGFVDELIVSTIIRDVLAGVEYIAKDGRVHRDIKAANILISENGTCQISDFGVSGAIIEGGLRKNGRHTFTGSLWWMAPEVLQRENRHSYQADIWSIGITALELAFGKPPHCKQRPVKVMLTILQSPPPSIDTMNAETNASYKYSKKFKDFLSKCLIKDAKKRPNAGSLMTHSFIKQAKDKQYLREMILSKHKHSKAYNNNCIPYSVEKKRRKQQDNDNDSDLVSGFDFNSDIHSVSQSEKQSIGRFDVSVHSKDDQQQQKGRFNIKKIN